MIVCKNDFRKEQLFLFSASAVLAGAAAGALFLSRVCTTGAFLVLMLLLGASYLCVWSRKLRKLSHPVMLLTAAYVAECLMQLQIEHRFDLLWSYQRIIDYLLYLGFFAFFAAAARRKSGGIIFGHIFFFAVATLNLMVTVFRGKPIYFPDLYSAGTAMDVAGSYSFPVSKVHIVSAMLIISMVLLAVASRTMDGNVPIQKRLLRASTIVLIPVLLVCLRVPTALKLRGYYFSTTEYWLYSFSMSTYQMQVVAPDGYDPAVIPIEASQDTDEETAGVLPNVLFIMNEAYADLRMIADFEEGHLAMPYFDELAKSDHAAVGELHTSIFGGNTANTEFEVLTGVSMAHLPYDTTAYNLYLNTETTSLAGYFGSLGYQTVAFHPSSATNYNRIHVYPNMGFQTARFQEDYEDLETLRTFTSDLSNYDKVIGLFESKPAGTPLFAFNVTVQNHGPFDILAEDFEQKVSLDEPGYPSTEQYLSCLKYSDEALEYLLTYLETYPEPVAVVFFGDHQAKIEDAFYEKLFGKSLSSLSAEENRMKYIVPYMIWTNYGLALEDDVDMSANYLGAYVLQVLNLPQTPYHTFLNALREKYPIMTLHGTIPAEGVTGDDQDLLDACEKISYNLLFDKTHLWSSLFTLDANG